jgi:hypothetical protein
MQGYRYREMSGVLIYEWGIKLWVFVKIIRKLSYTNINLNN